MVSELKAGMSWLASTLNANVGNSSVTWAFVLIFFLAAFILIIMMDSKSKR